MFANGEALAKNFGNAEPHFVEVSRCGREHIAF
jgi:hypothetical protein